MTSEARLSSNSQNWTKSLSFHDSWLSGQLSFEWPDWKSLGLNYSSLQREHGWKTDSVNGGQIHFFSKNSFQMQHRTFDSKSFTTKYWGNFIAVQKWIYFTKFLFNVNLFVLWTKIFMQKLKMEIFLLSVIVTSCSFHSVGCAHYYGDLDLVHLTSKIDFRFSQSFLFVLPV